MMRRHENGAVADLVLLQKTIRHDKITPMSTERIPPTPAQQRLVNIGLFIQYHIAVIGHFAVWLWVFCGRYFMHNDWDGLAEIFLYIGIPTSLCILVAVYNLFRWLLAYADFGTALTAMIFIDILHALLMCFTIFVPVRLAIPIVLYSIACYYYYTTWLCAQMQARENKEPADVS